MDNKEFLALLKKVSPLEYPEEEEALLEESFEEGFAAFMKGDTAYEKWEKSQD
jgi:hypothetical protein